MASCAASAFLLGAGVAAAQSASDGQPSAATAGQAGPSTTPETSDQAARAGATSQNTQAAGATAVGEVVVTATARNTRLQNLPVAVSAYTDERRNLVGILTASDIVNFTPSMSLNGEFLSLRGVGRYTNTLGIDPGVAVFVDGVYTPSPDYLNQPDFFTDRIEILRGPQGTLGGQNDIGGSVNIVEKRPTDQFHEELRTLLTNYEYHYVEGSVSGPIADHFRFRIADIYANQPTGDGYVTNLANPTHPGSGWSNLLEAQVDWKPTNNFGVWFKVQNYLLDNAAPYGLNNASSSGFNPTQYTPFPKNTPFGAANCPTINGTDYQCLVPNPTDLLPPASNPTITNPWAVNDNVVGYTKENNDWTFTGQVNWDFQGATLQYIGGYSQYDYLYQSDADGTPSTATYGALPPGFLSQINTGNQKEQWYQNELQLKSDNASRLSWIVGAFQYWNHYTSPYYDEEPNNPTLADPPNSAPNPNRAYYGQVAQLRDESEAIYGNVDYSVTDTLKLTGGLRYNWDRKSGGVTYREILDIAGIFGAPTLPAVDLGTVRESAVVSSSDWTGKIGAEWQPDSTTLVYGDITKGYKSGGMSLLNVSPIPTVGPETLYDYEVGVKKRVGGTLLVDADAYYYDYHNLQQFLSVDNAGLITSELVNAQRARTYGFELETVWSPTRDFQLTFNYSYLNARFTDFSLPNGPIVDVSQLAPGCVGTGAPGPVGTPGQCVSAAHANLNGSTLPQSPRNKVTVNPVYTFHLPLGNISLSATYASSTSSITQYSTIPASARRLIIILIFDCSINHRKGAIP
ncbi:MAG: TonB-dependent receptor [Caulobacteraceae bacterium]